MKFVITGTGRSGSKYISKVLNHLGIKCGHESIFNKWGKDKQTVPAWNGKYDGDSSYVATPFAHRFNGIVIHQQRDKSDCIDAYKRVGFLKGFKLGYEQFIGFHLPELHRINDYGKRLDYFYEHWNAMAKIESDLSYFVEDLDEYLLSDICILIGKPKHIDECRMALEKTDKNTNSTKSYTQRKSEQIKKK